MKPVSPTLTRAAARWTRAPEALFSNAFAAGFLLAALVLAIVSARVVIGGEPAAVGGRSTLVILGLNFVLILGLGGFLLLRIWRLAGGRKADDPAPKLHLRFVALFSLVAIVPAVVVGLLLGALFTRSMDSWFSERTRSAVEDAAALARSYLQGEEYIIDSQLDAMANDLNEQTSLLSESRITYNDLLGFHAGVRDFAAAWVIDSSGTVLARAAVEDSPTFRAPGLSAFATANQGLKSVADDARNDLWYVLYKLDAYDDAYLYVVRRLAPGIIANLYAASDSVNAYREADENRGRLQSLFGLLYIEMTGLLLTGAVWFGLAAANQVVGPVGRLVEGAERVRDGDLTARVEVGSERDELTALSQAFNEMTGQLASQRGELLKATREAETRREFTEAVLSGVSAGVMGVRADDRVSLTNRSALHLLAAGEESEVLGENIMMVAPEFAVLVREARSSPGSAAQRQADISRGGDVRRLNVRAAAARDGSGAVVITFDDITQLVTDQRNAAWQDVARRIAHEIKNPLTPIQLSAERLRRKYLGAIEGDKEVFERCVDTIVRQVSDIGRMVDEFSSFARMPEPKPGKVEMGELVRSAAFTQRVATPSIEIVLDTLERPAWVMCDERLIAQALTNILKNSAESVSARREEEPGSKGAPGRVEIALGVENGFAVVEVVDDGLGWPEVPRERLAEPYMTTREKGTGLGLAIVRRVMEDHHGRLELSDRVDGERGARVRLYLPLADRQNETTEETAQETAEGAADVEEQNTPGEKIAGVNV